MPKTIYHLIKWVKPLNLGTSVMYTSRGHFIVCEDVVMFVLLLFAKFEANSEIQKIALYLLPHYSLKTQPFVMIQHGLESA